MPQKKTKFNEEALVYCFRNGYRFYPITKDNVNYKIVVEKGLKRKETEIYYRHSEISEVIYGFMNKLLERSKAT